MHYIQLQVIDNCTIVVTTQLFMGQTGRHLQHQSMNTHPFQQQWKSSSICLHFWPREMNGLAPLRALSRPGLNPGLIAQVSHLYQLIGLWSQLLFNIQQWTFDRLLNKYFPHTMYPFVCYQKTVDPHDKDEFFKMTTVKL